MTRNPCAVSPTSPLSARRKWTAPCRSRRKTGCPIQRQVPRLGAALYARAIYDRYEGHPARHVLPLDEVRELATQDRNGGRWSLEPKDDDRNEFREAWERMKKAPCQGTACVAKNVLQAAACGQKEIGSFASL